MLLLHALVGANVLHDVAGLAEDHVQPLSLEETVSFRFTLCVHLKAPNVVWDVQLDRHETCANFCLPDADLSVSFLRSLESSRSAAACHV